MEPALPLNEQERRLALCQTFILERRPLVNAGRDSTEHLASARHLRVEQGRAIKGPLRRGGDEREADPVIFIEVLTKCHVPTEAEVRTSGVKKQDNGDGEYERNDFDGNFPGGCGSCRGHGCFRLDCPAAVGAGGAFICVGSGTQAHGGICWALAVQQLPPQSIG